MRELGIEQHTSLFAHCHYCPDPTGEKSTVEVITSDSVIAGTSEYIADAYTVTELGVMIAPEVNAADTGGLVPPSIKEKHGHEASLVFNAVFLCDVVISMIENNLVSVEECNARLKAA